MNRQERAVHDLLVVRDGALVTHEEIDQLLGGVSRKHLQVIVCRVRKVLAGDGIVVNNYKNLGYVAEPGDVSRRMPRLVGILGEAGYRDYLAFLHGSHSRDEALIAIGRADLVGPFA